MRTQSEWNVEISGRGVRLLRLERLARGRDAPLPSNSAAARCCISAAAFLVNVTARIRSGFVPLRISSAMR